MPPFRRLHQLGELVLPPGQTTAFGVTLNPGHKWLGLQPGDPSALLPQLCKRGLPVQRRARQHPKQSALVAQKGTGIPKLLGNPRSKMPEAARRLRLGCPHSLAPH